MFLPTFTMVLMTDPLPAEVHDFREIESAIDYDDPTDPGAIALSGLFEAWGADTPIPGDENRIAFSVTPPGGAPIIGMGFLYDLDVVGAELGIVIVETSIFVTSAIPGLAAAVVVAANGFEVASTVAGRPVLRVMIRA